MVRTVLFNFPELFDIGSFVAAIIWGSAAVVFGVFGVWMIWRKLSITLWNGLGFVVSVLPSVVGSVMLLNSFNNDFATWLIVVIGNNAILLGVAIALSAIIVDSVRELHKNDPPLNV